MQRQWHPTEFVGQDTQDKMAAAWLSRSVPLVLRAGLQYVDSTGAIVSVRRCGFVVGRFIATRHDGQSFTVTEAGGNIEPLGPHILRPVYLPGYRYADGNGVEVIVHRMEGGGRLFPVISKEPSGDSDAASYTNVGTYWSDDDSQRDLQDYAADIKDNEDMTTLPERTRVRFTSGGTTFTGTADRAQITMKDGADNDMIAVEVYELPGGKSMPLGLRNCDGQIKSGRGWYVRRAELEVVVDTAPPADPEADMPNPVQGTLVGIEPALLPHKDMHELWSLWLAGQAQDSNYPAWSMEELIEARKKLRDATEWTE